MSNSAKGTFLANFLIFAAICISTPNIQIMRYNGNLDVISVALFLLLIFQISLKTNKAAGSIIVALVICLTLVFNIASGLYVAQQQYFLSVNSLYLVLEVVSLLSATPQWKLLAGILIGCIFFVAMVPIAKRLVITNNKLAITYCAVLLTTSTTAQLTYAKVTREDIFGVTETTPIGYLFRSTGVFPYVQQDQEWLIDQERNIIVKKLMDDPNLNLPKKYSSDSLSPLLGRQAKRQSLLIERFPLYRGTQELNSPPNGLNVIVLLLESVRASEMGLYGAAESATPFLDKLALESTVASRFYATTNFTVKSEHAIHCSTYDYMIGPSIAKRDEPIRTDCLPNMLAENGYKTLWFHGNDKQFYSREAYLPKIGFQQIYSSDELNPNSKVEELGWGIADPLLLDMALEKLEAIEGPFYSEILTVSNHMPFDFDWNIEFPDNLEDTSNMYNRYRRGIYYTDQAVKHFYQNFLSSSLAKNTILVITGDHGIWTFSNEDQSIILKNEEFFRVPLIVKHPIDNGDNGKIIERNLSHVDIAPTILELLNFSTPNSFIGDSIFQKTKAQDSRVLYSMTEQGLSYRTIDSVCIPTRQCQNSINCYKTEELEPAPTQCYILDESADLLHKATGHSESVNNSDTNRALFDYSQIALKIGTSPDFSPKAIATATLETH